MTAPHEADRLRARAEEIFACVYAAVDYNGDVDAYDKNTALKEVTTILQQQQAETWREAAEYARDCENAEREYVTSQNERKTGAILAFHKMAYKCEAKAREVEG